MGKVPKLLFGKMSKRLLIFLVSGFVFALIISNQNVFKYLYIFVEGHNGDELALLLVSLMYLFFVMEISPLRQFVGLKKGLRFTRAEENDYRRRDKLYRAIFEQSDDAIILSDGKRILDLNRKSCEIFGFKPETPCNLSLISFVPGKYLPEFQQALREAFAYGSSLFEMKSTKPDGNLIDMELSLSLIDREGGIILIVSRDITELKKAGKLEQESRERLKAVLDNTLCGALLIEASTGKIVEANPAAMRAGGYSNSKIEGEDVPMLRSVVPVSIGGNGYFVESFVELSEYKE